MNRTSHLPVLASILAVLGCGRARPIQTGTGESPPEGGPVETPPDAGTSTSSGSCDLTVAEAPWLAFSSRGAGNYDVYIERADGTCLTAVTTDPGNNLYAAWAPDRKTLAFASDRGSSLRVFVHDFAAGTEVPLDVGTLLSTSPAYSPDGSAMALEGRIAQAPSPPTSTSSQAQAERLSTSRASRTRTPARPGRRMGPPSSSSPIDSGGVRRVSVPRDGGAAQAITTASRIIGKPAVSPGGTSLAYARTMPGASTTEVVLYDLATGAVRVITSENDSEPTFAPSGSELIVRSYRTGNPELFLIDLATGTELAQLTGDPASVGAATFRPPITEGRGYE